MSAPPSFKDCPLCKFPWRTLQEFIEDGSLEVKGYQAVFGTPEEGLILVTHERPDCGTTLGIFAGELKSLYTGPEYTDCCVDTELCRHLCLEQNRLEECSEPCAMAWVRVVLQYVRRHEMPPTT